MRIHPHIISTLIFIFYIYTHTSDVLEADGGAEVAESAVETGDKSKKKKKKKDKKVKGWGSTMAALVFSHYSAYLILLYHTRACCQHILGWCGYRTFAIYWLREMTLEGDKARKCLDAIYECLYGARFGVLNEVRFE